MKNWEYPNPIKGKDRLIMVEKKQNKNRHFNFRVNEKEYNKIKSQIEKSKLNTSEYLLRTAMDKDIIVVDGLEEIIMQLRKIICFIDIDALFTDPKQYKQSK